MVGATCRQRPYPPSSVASTKESLCAERRNAIPMGCSSHCFAVQIVAWFFSMPSRPAFDFARGGAVKVHNTRTNEGLEMDETISKVLSVGWIWSQHDCLWAISNQRKVGNCCLLRPTVVGTLCGSWCYPASKGSSASEVPPHPSQHPLLSEDFGQHEGRSKWRDPALDLFYTG